MRTTTRPDRPLPAPLPYASQAGRGEVPAPRPAEPVNPGGPLMREDERTLWIVIGCLVGYLLVMLAIAWHLNGGL